MACAIKVFDLHMTIIMSDTCTINVI